MLAGTVQKENKGFSSYGSSATKKDQNVIIRISSADKAKLKEVSERKNVTMTDLILNLLEVAYF